MDNVITGIACLIVFLIMAMLMYGRRISALLALPIMAVAIAVVGQVPPDRILSDVIAKGCTKLNNAYTTTIFGAILAELINKLGIARALVRFVAEFAGDSPFLLGLCLTLVTALLFSSLGGLGAVIMVGTVVLPVMLSLGISSVTAGSLFLFGINLGGMFNLSNWALYEGVLQLSQVEISSYVMPFGIGIGCLVVIFLAAELRSLRNLKYLFGALTLLAGGFLSLHLVKQQSLQAAMPVQASAVVADNNSIYIAAATLIVLCLLAVLKPKQDKALPALAFLSPALPLLLVLAFRWEIVPAFCFGIAYAVLVTWQKDSVNTLTRSIIEGTQTVAPAVVLMLGIGMLMAAVMDPKISGAIAPLLTAAVPTSALPYVVTFTLLAPLALYRGPLSLWGMGSGLVALIRQSTTLGSPALMSMLMSVGQLQGVCDPTNTHNVWIATYLGTDTQTLLKRTIPYAWSATLLGLMIAVFFHFVN
jgi:hypothetical protein